MTNYPGPHGRACLEEGRSGCCFKKFTAIPKYILVGACPTQRERAGMINEGQESEKLSTPEAVHKEKESIGPKLPSQYI